MRNNTSSTTGAAAGDVWLCEPWGASSEMRRGGLAGAARCCEPRGISPEMRRAASRRGSRRRCATGPEEEEAGAIFYFFAPDPTAAQLASSGYGWTGRKFRPVRRRLAMPLHDSVFTPGSSTPSFLIACCTARTSVYGLLPLQGHCMQFFPCILVSLGDFILTLIDLGQVFNLQQRRPIQCNPNFS